MSVVNVVKTGFDKPSFAPVPVLTSDPPPELNNRNRGLTRVYLDWDLRWDTISTDFYDSVDGFAVILHPDQKSVSYPVPDKGLPPFYLPKWVYAKIMDDDDDVDYRAHTRVEGFAVGGLGYYPGEDVLPLKIAGEGSDSVAHWPASEGVGGIIAGFFRNFPGISQSLQQVYPQHALGAGVHPWVPGSCLRGSPG